MLEYESEQEGVLSGSEDAAENPVVAEEADEVLVQRGAPAARRCLRHTTWRDGCASSGWYVAEGVALDADRAEGVRRERDARKVVEGAVRYRWTTTDAEDSSVFWSVWG
ncbi:MAG: hypothetical protein U5J64_05965 [Halobacteriales archaeon]|nr:hypothetical protein [Halobacteriales archaeon]